MNGAKRASIIGALSDYKGEVIDYATENEGSDDEQEQRKRLIDAANRVIIEIFGTAMSDDETVALCD